MASIAQVPKSHTVLKSAGPDRILLRNISWEFYQRLRDEESNWGVRMAFDSGDLELMSPSQRHEEIGYRFELFMAALDQALGFKFAGMAHTTWINESAEKAKEADACYYIQNFERIRGKDIDLRIDPPPDLAVEVEVSRSSIDSLNIYATLGVPEIWRIGESDSHIHLRQSDGSYLESDRSVALPFIAPTEILSWLQKAKELSDNMDWMTQVQEWARVELTPRLEPR